MQFKMSLNQNQAGKRSIIFFYYIYIIKIIYQIILKLSINLFLDSSKN